MYALRKTLSVLLVLILVPVLMGQITAHTARDMLLDAAFPQRIAREADLYVKLEAIITEGIVETALQQPSPLPVTRADIERFAREVLPAERIQRIAEDVMAGLHAWALGSDPVPELYVDLSEVREALPEAVRTIVTEKMAELPVCTQDQLAQLIGRTGSELPACRTDDPRLNQVIIDQVVAGLNVDQVPARVDLATVWQGDAGPAMWEENWYRLQEARLVLNAIPYGWAVVGFLLLLLALLNLDRWYTPFGWIGAVGLLGGGLVFVGAISLAGLALPAMAAAVVGAPEAEVILDVVRAAISALAVPLRNNSFLVILIGLAAVIIAVVGAITAPKPPSEEIRSAS